MKRSDWPDSVIVLTGASSRIAPGGVNGSVIESGPGLVNGSVIESVSEVVSRMAEVTNVVGCPTIESV